MAGKHDERVLASPLMSEAPAEIQEIVARKDAGGEISHTEAERVSRWLLTRVTHGMTPEQIAVTRSRVESQIATEVFGIRSPLD